jgi:hypothetical protein
MTVAGSTSVEPFCFSPVASDLQQRLDDRARDG